MNYQWHYDRLISARKERSCSEDQYYESHHIIPKSMGGTNDIENLIKLTPREHFLAHWMLWRIHKNKQMADAFFSMCGFRNKKRKFSTSSISYAEAKEAKSNKKGHLVSEETRQKISLASKGNQYMKGKKLSDEAKLRISEFNKGKKLSEETKNKIGKSRKGKLHSQDSIEKIKKVCKGKQRSLETREKISKVTSGENNPMFSRKHSEETKQKMREARKNKKK